MGAPWQHVLRRARLQLRDRAHDLAGADIERGDDGGAAARDRLHLGRKAVGQIGHASPPFFLALRAAASASSRACATASESRTVNRSGSRRSIAAMSRLSKFFSAWKRA